MPRKDPHPGSISAKAQQDLVSDGIENFELPKSVITKIARSAVRPRRVFYTFILCKSSLDTGEREVAKGNHPLVGERLYGLC